MVAKARAALEGGAASLLDELRLSLDYLRRRRRPPCRSSASLRPGRRYPRSRRAGGADPRYTDLDRAPRGPRRPRCRLRGPPDPLLRPRAGELAMRPVNLIPPEERPGQPRPMRSGPLAYIVVGAMVAALAGVTVLVVTDNQIGERRAEIVQLKAKRQRSKARAPGSTPTGSSRASTSSASPR